MTRTLDLDKLAALGAAGSLSAFRDTGGLASIASIAREIEKFKAHGGLEKLRRQTEALLGTRDYFLREARKVASALEDAERVRKSFASQLFDATSTLERYRRMASDALGPLSALRSASLYESEVARLTSARSGSVWVQANSIAEEMRKQREMLAYDFADRLSGGWLGSARKLASEFANASETLRAQALRDLKVFDPAEIARRHGLPVLDRASFAALRHMEGVEGLLAQLKAFGIDDSILRAVASSAGSAGLEPAEGGEPSDAAKRKLTPEQMARLWNIVFVIFSILFPIYQWWESNQSDSQLMGAIKASEERSAQKLEAMSKLMDQVVQIAEREVLDGGVNFVVRERVALIRTRPKSGSTVIAEVFPNQVVTLVEERGKWIRVEYYDWLAREERSGWALKKYFAKMDGSAPQRRRSFSGVRRAGVSR